MTYIEELERKVRAARAWIILEGAKKANHYLRYGSPSVKAMALKWKTKALIRHDRALRGEL